MILDLDPGCSLGKLASASVAKRIVLPDLGVGVPVNHPRHQTSVGGADQLIRHNNGHKHSQPTQNAGVACI